MKPYRSNNCISCYCMDASCLIASLDCVVRSDFSGRTQNSPQMYDEIEKVFSMSTTTTESTDLYMLFIIVFNIVF